MVCKLFGVFCFGVFIEGSPDKCKQGMFIRVLFCRFITDSLSRVLYSKIRQWQSIFCLISESRPHLICLFLSEPLNNSLRNFNLFAVLKHRPERKRDFRDLTIYVRHLSRACGITGWAKSAFFRVIHGIPVDCLYSLVGAYLFYIVAFCYPPDKKSCMA